MAQMDSEKSGSKGRSGSPCERGEAWCEGEGNFLDNVYRE